MRKTIVFGVILMALAAGMATARAADEDVQATIKQLQTQLAAQQKELEKIKGQQVDVAELLEKQRANEEKLYKVADDIGKVDWLHGLKFNGDFRLRYQGQSYRGYNQTVPKSQSKPWRNRARYRLRLGMEKTLLDDEMLLGVRLASGDFETKYPGNNEPTSTNATFTNDFSKKDIWIDQAYVKYTPKAIKGLLVVGGKMPTPMVHTDMIWDDDVNPEGFWAQYQFSNLPNGFKPFVGAGYFLVKENGQYDYNDCTMADFEVGYDWELAKDFKWTLAANYYVWDNYQYSYNYGAANGNDVLSDKNLAAGAFRVFNLTNEFKFKLFGKENKAYFDWAYNCADDDLNYDYKNQNKAYAVGYKFGNNKKKGDWAVEYKYAYIEANATPGYFADSDFGYVNKKGHVIGTKYNLTDFMTIGGKVYLTQDIAGPMAGPTDVTTQFDVEWKF